MKRTPLRRKTRLTAKHANRKPRTPLKKVNPTRQAKRRKSYAQKLAAYRRSATYKIVEQRAGGRCENVIQREVFLPGSQGMPRISIPAFSAFSFLERSRCERRDSRHHHHKTYARFGGKELPDDMLAVCTACHALLEAEHPTRRRSQRKGGA